VAVLVGRLLCARDDSQAIGLIYDRLRDITALYASNGPGRSYRHYMEHDTLLESMVIILDPARKL